MGDLAAPLSAMDELDRKLLNRIQASVPLVARPFSQLADELGCDESAVIQRITALRQAGIIREISAIFDAVALGYRQALVALNVPPEKLGEAGRAAAGHPGVSHCYGRTGDLNLWLTLAVSPASRLGLHASAALLARLTGATTHVVLPTIRRYKLQVRFDMESDEPTPAPATTNAPGASEPGSATNEKPAPALTDTQLRAIRALQIDLPDEPEPFGPLAATEGLDVGALLACGRELLDTGHMRRYSAVLHHRAVGGKANVLVAWIADDAQADADGPLAARVTGISHCYLRPAGHRWPYSIYTMIHGRSQQDCRKTIETVLATTSLTEYVELWTTAEYKKRRVPLFGPQEAAWESTNAQTTITPQENAPRHNGP